MPDQFQLFKGANFQTYTLAQASTGTGTGSQVWTIAEAFNGFPTEFPIRAEIYEADASLYTASREIVEISGNNIPSQQITVSQRALERTSVYNHQNGAKIRLVITEEMWNHMVDEIRYCRTLIASLASQSTITTLLAQGNVPVTTTFTAGEVFNGTTTVGGITSRTVLCINASNQLQRLTDAFDAEHMGRVVVAYDAGPSVIGQPFRVFLPGSIIDGFVGLTLSTTYYPSSTPGGVSATKGTRWISLFRALSGTTAFFIDFGRNNLTHQAATAPGTLPHNSGTSDELARADHEHKVYYEWTPIIQAPASGSTSFLFANKTPLTYDIVGFYVVVVGTVGSTPSTISLEKMAQTTVDGAFSPWAAVTAPHLTIDASERSSNTAATPVGLAGATLAPGEHIRMNVIAAGTNLGDIQGFVVMKLKNTN